ncbi:MarR family winged helix-turn-helix transcriptional regulator [Nitrincola alkalilacustris]|uniref:MarR family winged helix-turn-helix transcriptional regulator n=1 Tax=Nitrincola alkalilacustris TaxID=1571224 RepID=UPI00124DE2AA|nr:MarR family transcriptional regulator [Nitrincola alkalilacustris]
MTDSVDRILQQWSKARPDLDCSAMGVVGRVGRVSMLWGKQMDAVFEPQGLSRVEFDILATLRRSQVPLTPTELYQTLMLSSGAMSTRIEVLVQRGLIERMASEEDRRSCKVALTEQGVAVLDQALESHLANMDQMLSCLDGDDKTQLAGLLKKILLSSE